MGVRIFKPYEDEISIHALREEGDMVFGDGTWYNTFLSTPSARRATRGAVQSRAMHRPISIHALREEGDSKNRDKISIFL